ncbi:response regulator [Fibrella sp. HMF5335]|uniref:histidine kinase n=1 Tax=Fibrella rubiginis TaxID=2817060 RepID=A0A939GI57_9BACT|nr:response regulator [Fibrella rubiginis]MBO0937200.1 response regulator [Fibrella rubiginis]
MTTILVVDDEPDLEPLLLNWFRRKIRDSTYVFHFAHDGYEALALLQQEPTIDLLLLDINMPDMDGLTLLAKLPALNPFLLVVMVSAYGDMTNIRAAMNRGAFDFVCKPIVFTDLDITIEKTARQVRQRREAHQLKVIDELKTRFFDNITHEFRTPLTLILAPVEQLLKRFRDSAELQHSLGIVERNARQLLRLINQLLDLAKLESGHLTVSLQAGDLGDFVGQIVRAFEPMAREKNLTLTYENELTDFYTFDADKLEQVAHNLIANALKFTSAGQVMVRLSQEAMVQLTVTDTGIGIVPEKLPYIFNRFYQVQEPDVKGRAPSHQFASPGTGIGLALVNELTELMGGRVSVSSVSTRAETGLSGTTFTVELPLSKVHEETGNDPLIRPLLPVAEVVALIRPLHGTAERESTTTEKPLVLVVEDNAELNAFIAGELADSYRILTAFTGDEGWALAQAELPDLVLSDIMMPGLDRPGLDGPGLDGYQLTRRLKTDPATDHIAVVLLTAKVAQSSRMEGLEEGADDYIGKPFHVDELRLRIHNLLARQQALRAHFQQQLSHPNEPISPETVADSFIRNLYTLIEKHLDDSQFRVDELAQAVGMSRRTLHRKLASVTSLNVTDFIRQYRLKRACELLRQGYNVSETAYMIGYESPSHFSTVFREFFGKTPTVYVEG